MGVSGDEREDTLRRAKQLYFIPLSDDAVSTRLASAGIGIEAGYQELFAAFIHNLETAHSTLSMPYTMAYGAAMNTHWRRFWVAASIRAGDVDPKDPSKVAEREAGIRKTTSDQLWQFINSPEGQEHLTYDICNFLLEVMVFGRMPAAVPELVQQGTVLVWSALEVLVRDLLELELNRNPRKLADLAADPDARKRYGLDRIPLDVILANGLDLSNKMGSIVMKNTDFSDLPGMKLVLGLLFPKSVALRSALADRQLWELYQRRNLIAHRRGVIDQTYLDKTGEQGKVGSSVEVRPSDLDRYFECVTQAGLALLDCCPKRQQEGQPEAG
ncbi:hypothetical protein BQ8794_170019 [Mesorhizobium prunaredense]|uniref:RiboL-PSP-HEPN domain-containing protein n=1 Tax=Mesorhizobium prunaredense TaxID=1631249 RepID=A0A1R3V6V2_9HYPH|nr:hypothetical protein [Mesorhizobium prunaredense]SIT54526.1 hypothetical protein BQ8794_170019 [Mesorhizobium prunaredense]